MNGGRSNTSSNSIYFVFCCASLSFPAMVGDLNLSTLTSSNRLKLQLFSLSHYNMIQEEMCFQPNCGISPVPNLTLEELQNSLLHASDHKPLFAIYWFIPCLQFLSKVKNLYLLHYIRIKYWLVTDWSRYLIVGIFDSGGSNVSSFSTKSPSFWTPFSRNGPTFPSLSYPSSVFNYKWEIITRWSRNLGHKYSSG